MQSRARARRITRDEYLTDLRQDKTLLFHNAVFCIPLEFACYSAGSPTKKSVAIMGPTTSTQRESDLNWTEATEGLILRDVVSDQFVAPIYATQSAYCLTLPLTAQLAYQS